MNLKTLSLAALAALFALPAVAAHGSGPDVTVTVDTSYCQTTPIDVEDLLGPGVETRTDIWFDDCDASVGYDGSTYHAHCAEILVVDETCGVAVVV